METLKGCEHAGQQQQALLVVDGANTYLAFL